MTSLSIYQVGRHWRGAYAQAYYIPTICRTRPHSRRSILHHTYDPITSHKLTALNCTPSTTLQKDPKGPTFHECAIAVFPNLLRFPCGEAGIITKRMEVPPFPSLSM